MHLIGKEVDITGQNKNRRGTKKGALKLESRARALGVTASHLSQVISGKRESPGLLNRFIQLAESEKQQQKENQ